MWVRNSDHFQTWNNRYIFTSGQKKVPKIGEEGKGGTRYRVPGKLFTVQYPVYKLIALISILSTKKVPKIGTSRLCEIIKDLYSPWWRPFDRLRNRPSILRHAQHSAGSGITSGLLYSPRWWACSDVSAFQYFRFQCVDNVLLW